MRPTARDRVNLWQPFREGFPEVNFGTPLGHADDRASSRRGRATDRAAQEMADLPLGATTHRARASDSKGPVDGWGAPSALRKLAPVAEDEVRAGDASLPVQPHCSGATGPPHRHKRLRGSSHRFLPPRSAVASHKMADGPPPVGTRKYERICIERGRETCLGEGVGHNPKQVAANPSTFRKGRVKSRWRPLRGHATDHLRAPCWSTRLPCANGAHSQAPSRNNCGDPCAPLSTNAECAKNRARQAKTRIC